MLMTRGSGTALEPWDLFCDPSEVDDTEPLPPILRVKAGRDDRSCGCGGGAG